MIMVMTKCCLAGAGAGGCCWCWCWWWQINQLNSDKWWPELLVPGDHRGQMASGGGVNIGDILAPRVAGTAAL